MRRLSAKIGDRVRYIGSRYRDITNKVGEVTAIPAHEPVACVTVRFGDRTFILMQKSLSLVESGGPHE